MQLLLTAPGDLDIQSNLFTLSGLRPVLNGVPLLDWTPEITFHAADHHTLVYTAPDQAKFTFDIRHDDQRATIRYRLTGLDPARVIDSFGLMFERVENVRAYLRSGYTSWDGSFYVEPEGLRDFEPYETRPETGFAMTQLLPRQGNGNLVLGFDRHDRCQQTFTFDTRRAPLALTILTLWDQKAHDGTCESEKLVIFEHTDTEEALREWARLVAAASIVPPRVAAPPITGWCSWYNLYAYINEDVILEHLHGVAETMRRANLPMRVFQIDDGFTPEMGDWLDVKSQFPRGMKPLIDDIRATGFVPGLWIGPFMVGNRSRLYREHPDWVVQDRQTGGPLAHWRFYGEGRWHKRSEEYYILDATHPDAFAYLRQVFHTWRWEWGCEYFKTDFMFWGSEYGPDRAVWHTPGQTRIEVWRRVADMIREEIGDAIWVGCGCPLWASAGLVDGIRIGHDVGVTWLGQLSAESLLRDQAARNFTNHILWQTDPDCILLREPFHYLTETELRSLAIYAGMCGGVTLTSDALHELSPERVDLWKLLLPTRTATCNFPFLGQSTLIYDRVPAERGSQKVEHRVHAADPVLVQVRPGPEMAAVFIFNTGEIPVQRSYTLSSLGLPDRAHVYDWTADRALAGSTDRISVTLQPHDGALLFVAAQAITTRPDRLP